MSRWAGRGAPGHPADHHWVRSGPHQAPRL